MWGLLLLLMGTTCRGAGDHGNATTLTKDTFDAFLQQQREQQRAALVMFHVSWCKACQRTFPTFAAAATSAAVPSEVPVAFAHVDCTDDKALCQKFEVQGYPTIKFFFPEEERPPQNFRGHRSIEGFLRYARRMTSAPIRHMSLAELEEALKTESYSALLLLERHAESMLPVARRWMDRHVIAMAAELGQLLPQAVGNVPAEASLAVFSPARQQWPGQSGAVPAVAFFQGSMENTSAVDEWIAAHRFPGVWALQEQNFYEFTHSDRSAVLVAVAEATEALEAEVRGAQQRFAEHFVFGAMNGSHWAQELKHFNIQPQELPRVLLSEKNFELWIEDAEGLRALALTEDLQKLLDGAPLLRQGRTATSKIFFYKREAARVLGWALTHWQSLEGLAILLGATGVAIIVIAALALVVGTLTSSEEAEEKKRR